MWKYQFYTPDQVIPKGIVFWVYRQEGSEPVEIILSDKQNTSWEFIPLQFYSPMDGKKNVLTHFGFESDDVDGMSQEEALNFISIQ